MRKKGNGVIDDQYAECLFGGYWKIKQNLCKNQRRLWGFQNNDIHRAGILKLGAVTSKEEEEKEQFHVFSGL